MRSDSDVASLTISCFLFLFGDAYLHHAESVVWLLLNSEIEQFVELENLVYHNVEKFSHYQH